MSKPSARSGGAGGFRGFRKSRRAVGKADRLNYPSMTTVKCPACEHRVDGSRHGMRDMVFHIARNHPGLIAGFPPSMAGFDPKVELTCVCGYRATIEPMISHLMLRHPIARHFARAAMLAMVKERQNQERQKQEKTQ